MTTNVINDSLAARVGDYFSVNQAEIEATTTQSRAADPRSTATTETTQSHSPTNHQRRYIKTKVSKVSSKTSSKPFLNGAIISLVIYSLYQILANNLANVLSNNDESSLTTTKTRYLPITAQTGNIFKQHRRSYDIDCPQDGSFSSLFSLSCHDLVDKNCCLQSQGRIETRQSQMGNKKHIASLTKLDSHEETATSLENKQQCHDNDEAAARQWSSSSEQAMIYEVSHLLSQLVQSTQRNFYKIVNDVLGQLKLIPHHHHYHRRRSPSSFGSGGILFAQAAQVAATTTSKSTAMNDRNKDQRSIINLNVTNFNEELIQDRHPFPHIKLIEYYLPFCGICRKFKSTYVQLAREVHLWRNVIRPSAIDLSLAFNSPIAQSWSIEEVPTLRIHPPPSETLSSRLQSQYRIWKSDQTALYREYSSSVSMVRTLKVTKYTNDSEPSGSHLLSSDLLEYVHDFIEQNPAQLPKTWPNFKPVTETTLEDLMKNHKRPELFLLIEQKSPVELASDDNSDDQSNPTKSSRVSLGFKTVMDLSASPAYKAIRYMYASENEALLKEIISYADRQQSTLEVRSAIETLSSLLKKRQPQEEASSTDQEQSSADYNSRNGNNKLVLVHVDLTHQNNNTLLSSIYPIPFVHIVTPADLIKFEAQHNAQMSSASPLALQNNRRRLDNSISHLSRRSLLLNSNEQTGATDEATNVNDDDLGRRQQHQQQQQEQKLFMQLSPEERIRLLTLYVNEIYTPQPEDKAFVEGLEKFDESPTSNENKLEALKLSRRTYVDATHETSSGSIIGEPLKAISRLFKAATTTIAPATSSTADSNNNLTVDNGKSSNSTATTFTTASPSKLATSSSISTNFGSCRNKGASDYNDKLKAIRYSLFNEVPRKLMNPSEHREKIRTLLDLITVIKHYFPLPDSASIQFIDGVHRFLTRYQYQSSPLSDQYATHAQGGATTNGVELNAQAFKRELKRLESEGKRLPEIQEWSYCGSSGYACGLWRLFHTLTAFEYKKLSQISSPQIQQLQQQQQHQQVALGQHLSKGSNHQQQSEYSYVNVANESRQSQQLQQLQKHQQQLVKLTPAIQSSSTLATSSAKPSDKTSGMIQDRNTTSSTSTPHNTAMLNSAEVTMPSPVERVVSPPASSTSLSLTIATPTSSTGRRWGTSSSDILTATSAELPTPVLLVMRDYVTNFFSCEDCAKNFRIETANLSLDRITQFESPEFSVLWLWETHNRISKRLSVDNETNPHRPKNWYPSYEQCNQCYKKPPSYLNDPTADSAVIFRESVEWNKEEILRFLVGEYTKTPMDNGLDLFGYQVPYGFVWIVFITCVIFMIIIRCAASYIERQRRHKAAVISNGNGVNYSPELQ